MCVVSMIYNNALKWPTSAWEDPVIPPIFNDLVKDARQYDVDNNEPDCELEEKKLLLKKLADQLGVSINF